MRILYWVMSPSITCKTIWIILDPTVMGMEIDPIVEHKASLKAFNYKLGIQIYNNERFRFL